MDTFLTRLAARTLGFTSGVQPLLDPLFAPGAALTGDEPGVDWAAESTSPRQDETNTEYPSALGNEAVSTVVLQKPIPSLLPPDPITTPSVATSASSVSPVAEPASSPQVPLAEPTGSQVPPVPVSQTLPPQVAQALPDISHLPQPSNLQRSLIEPSPVTPIASPQLHDEHFPELPPDPVSDSSPPPPVLNPFQAEAEAKATQPTVTRSPPPSVDASNVASSFPLTSDEPASVIQPQHLTGLNMSVPASLTDTPISFEPTVLPIAQKTPPHLANPNPFPLAESKLWSMQQEGTSVPAVQPAVPLQRQIQLGMTGPTPQSVPPFPSVPAVQSSVRSSASDLSSASKETLVSRQSQPHSSVHPTEPIAWQRQHEEASILQPRGDAGLGETITPANYEPLGSISHSDSPAAIRGTDSHHSPITVPPSSTAPLTPFSISPTAFHSETEATRLNSPDISAIPTQSEVSLRPALETPAIQPRLETGGGEAIATIHQQAFSPLTNPRSQPPAQAGTSNRPLTKSSARTPSFTPSGADFAAAPISPAPPASVSPAPSGGSEASLPAVHPAASIPPTGSEVQLRYLQETIPIQPHLETEGSEVIAPINNTGFSTLDNQRSQPLDQAGTINQASPKSSLKTLSFPPSRTDSAPASIPPALPVTLFSAAAAASEQLQLPSSISAPVPISQTNPETSTDVTTHLKSKIQAQEQISRADGISQRFLKSPTQPMRSSLGAPLEMANYPGESTVGALSSRPQGSPVEPIPLAPGPHTEPSTVGARQSTFGATTVVERRWPAIVPRLPEAAPWQDSTRTHSRDPGATRLPSTAPPPTIQVKIGRIEVRRVNPPAPPPARSPSKSTGPTLSLEDYLQQRNGGAL